MIKIEDIAAVALSQAGSLVPSWLPAGKFRGSEFVVGSLDGEAGKSLSISIRTGKWCDFSTGDRGGDLVSLYASIHRLNQGQAANELAVQFGMTSGDAVERAAKIADAKAKAPKQKTFEYLPPVGVPDHNHFIYGSPAAVWTYTDAQGALVGYVCRYNLDDGTKQVWPRSYGVKPDKHGNPITGWHWQAFKAPRPLYNLPSLAAEKAQVLVVEGEKTSEFVINRTNPDKVAVVTWAGGGKAVHLTDWSPLAGRAVAISPDADDAGYDTARRIAEILTGLGCTIRYVLPPDGVPDGWDFADSDLTAETIMAHVRGHISKDLNPKPVELTPEPVELEEQPIELGEYQDDYEVTEEVVQLPFRCLGYDKDGYYYFSSGKQQIVTLSASGHTKPNMIQLAPRDWWIGRFPKGKGQDFDIDSAQDYMMRGCESMGIFNSDRVRGRGAWFERDGIAVHLGNKVIINGQHMPPSKVVSNYIYEAADPISADLSTPLLNAEANKFVRLLQMLPFERPIDAKLAAGWCVTAHIGGAMLWRPHIWIIGRKGSGKTWVMKNVIQAVMGKNCLFVQAGSSEAGIRQQLGVDSLPVLFDEAEGEDHQAHANIQRVLGLIRQSSSETGGRIAKGTPSGKAQKFMVRSAFALSSINANLVQQSDKSRITILELNKDHRKYDFETILRQAAVITDDYVMRFYARAIQLAPVIRKNAVTFAKAAAAELGEQRAGDQIGTLLAGAYSLFSDKEITDTDAVAWIQQQDWTETKEEMQGETDETQLYSHLMQQKLSIRIADRGNEDMPIGYLVEVAMSRVEHLPLTAHEANKQLQSVGFKVTPDGLYISNTSPHIKRMLANTQWPVNWGKVLRRLNGAASSAKPVYFGYKGSEARATFIPLDD